MPADAPTERQQPRQRSAKGLRAAAPASEDDELARLRAENESLRTSLSAAEDHLSALLNEREGLRKELGY